MTPKLIGKKIILRQIMPSDIDNFIKVKNDKAVTKYMTHIRQNFSKKDALKYLEEKRKNLKAEKEIPFGIALKENNKIIGGLDLHQLDLKNGHSELGYWLGKDYWGKGIMTEAIGLALDFGFKKLKLHRIYANVWHKNIASQKILKKFGFKLEGKMREKWRRENQWHDVLNYAILDREYGK